MSGADEISSPKEFHPNPPGGSETRKKFWFYLAFTGLAAFFAEAAGGNMPFALINPLIYVAYGIPFVLFIDDLLRYGEDRFHPWYLSGWLVGWVTEAYVAKVVFFGWSAQNIPWNGFAVGPILIVVFFYHPWITFILPAYVARRLLDFPFPLRISPWRDRLAIVTPLLLALLGGTVATMRGTPLILAVFWFFISTLVLFLLLAKLEKIENIEDLRLSVDERRRFIIVGLVFYSFFLSRPAGAEHVEGLHAPFWPMVIATLISLLVYVLMRFSVELRGKTLPGQSFRFVPGTMRTRPWKQWLLGFTAVVGSLVLLFPAILGGALGGVSGGILIIGVFFGVGCAIYCGFSVIRSLFRG